MNYDIEIINPIDFRGWDNLLISNQKYTFFHTSAWAKVLWETYRYRLVYFTIFDGKRLLALIPMMQVKSIFTGCRGVSLPFSDYCEPVISNGLQVHDVIDFVKEYGREFNWRSIEYRGGHYPGITPSASFYLHRLKLLSDTEQMFSGFRGSTRRNIRKAIREGVEVNVYSSLRAVNEYYRLHCITRKKIGLPPQPHSFFRKVYEHIISNDLGFVVLASYSGKNIAGSVFFNFKNQSLFKFGASDHRYQNLRASDLVMWESIKRCSQKGCRILCLGRTALNNQGLRKFKAGWGTDEQIINYYKYDLQQNIFVAEKQLLKDFHNHIFRMMPVSFLRTLGFLLYKHIG